MVVPGSVLCCVCRAVCVVLCGQAVVVLCCAGEQESPGQGVSQATTKLQPPRLLSCFIWSTRVSALLTHTHISHTRAHTNMRAHVQGPLSELFDQQQLLYDVSGAGNNWAHGHHGYGPQYRDSLCEQLRRAAEDADSLQVGWVG